MVSSMRPLLTAAPSIRTAIRHRQEQVTAPGRLYLWCFLGDIVAKVRCEMLLKNIRSSTARHLKELQLMSAMFVRSIRTGLSATIPPGSTTDIDVPGAVTLLTVTGLPCG